MVATRASGRGAVAGVDWIDRIRRSRRGRWIKRYKPSDTSHRHRIPDRQPKTTRVVSYTRRI